MEATNTVCSAYGCGLLILAGVAPSILWLLFFFFQDKHREKVKNIITIFLWGIIISFPIVIVETTAQSIMFSPFAAIAISPIVFTFIGIAFVEEMGKYLVIRFKAMGKAFFDEPQDAMLYMIVVALGFAAIENIAYILNIEPNSTMDFSFRMNVALVRGITSTLLHVVASGTLGYFLALSIANRNEGKKFLYTGIALATLLHGIYNHFIMKIDSQINKIGEFGTFFSSAITAALLVLSGTIIVITFHKLSQKNIWQNHFSKN